MTGRRRDKGKPIGVIATAQNSWAHFQERLSRATRPSHQIHAWCSYLAAVLERADPAVEVRNAAKACQALAAIAQDTESDTVASGRQRAERRGAADEHHQRRHAG